MFVYIDNKEISKEMVFNKYSKDTMPSTLSSQDITNVFRINEDDKGVEYISVDNIDLLRAEMSDLKSVQYWYQDANGNMNFVFGVNVKDNENSIRINLSLISTKDPRVFDDNHNVVGVINNYTKQGNNKPYRNNQFFDII